MNLSRFWLAASVVLYSCDRPKESDDKKLHSYQAPTASEVFDLRSKCAALGEKIMEDNFIGSALTQEQLSHYDSRTNHCYVKLDVHTADLSTPRDKFIQEQFLYDGQTRELLATSTLRDGKKFGSLYGGLEKLAHDQALPTYPEVIDIIDKFMAEDRNP